MKAIDSFNADSLSDEFIEQFLAYTKWLTC